MRTIAILALGLTAGAIVHAAPVTVVRQHFSYEVLPDGTWTMEVDQARRVDEVSAVAGLGQAPVQYSESLQTLEILEAYTTTPAGVRIDVAPDKILTQQLPASAGAPTFSDTKLRTVVFPQVEIGATLNLRYRVKQLKPYLPGLFSVVVTAPLNFDTQSSLVTLRAPENLKLHFSSRDMQGGEVKSSTPGQREWRWAYGNAKGVVPEPGSLTPEALSPYVSASTLEAYPELGEKYMIGAANAARVTPAVQKLADEITAGITDRRAQAEALYRWVSTQIRYVAIAMGTGGYVPHLADEVIAARYGDCKDKSTLLMALLHAKGIRAMPALIHTGPTFKLPEGVFLSAFNHAINYLPEWDLFVDSTSGFAPFGVLTSSLQNKPALLGGDQTLRAAVKHTPAASASQDRLSQRTVARITEDGTITGETRIEPAGSAGPDLRGSIGTIPEQMRPQLAKALMPGLGQAGEATMTLSDARDLARPFSIVLGFKAPQQVNIPGPGALVTAFGMPLLQTFVTSMLQVERKLDFPCPAASDVEDYLELALAPQVTITNLPRPASVESRFGRFTTSHESRDGRLVVTRRLVLTTTNAVCTAADAEELRKFASGISQQLRAQVLYQ